MMVRKSIITYDLYFPMKIKCYFKGFPVRGSRIGKGHYRFDIKRKWGYQQNRYIMKSYWDDEFHIKDNPKLYNFIKLEEE